MSEAPKTETAELSDYKKFRQSIEALDRIVGSNRRTYATAILAIVATLTVPFVTGGVDPLKANAIVDAFMILGVGILIYGFGLQRDTIAIRSRLAEQLDIAVKQQVRAEKLYGLSILDPLTGLHNRRFGEERLKEEISRAERNNDALAVLLFDLDYFKEINDQHGHAAGDLALKEFSRKLKRAIRACDVPVRIGGDEFLVILPECPRESIDVILARIGSPQFDCNGQRITVCYSVGRAHYQVSDTTETLLARADEVMYGEKARRHPGKTPQAIRTAEPLEIVGVHEFDEQTAAG